jgi:hypothetical protein
MDASGDRGGQFAASPRNLMELATAIGRPGELAQACAGARRRPENVLGLLLRPPGRDEIAVMEGRGCRADDWSLVQVAEDFDAFRVRRTHLIGRCILGRFSGMVEVAPDIRLPTGIYDCTLIDTQVGNDCLLEEVRFAARCIFEHGSVIVDVGSITCTGTPAYACGQEVSVGCEPGGREVWLWPEIDIDTAALIVSGKADVAGQAAVRAAVENCRADLACGVTWVRRGVRVRHTNRVCNSYLGYGTVVDQALELDNCCIFSLPEEPVCITAGASVRDSIIHPGVAVSGGAIVRRSVLLEHATVDKRAVIEASIIGPNTVIAQGEVTASLVGPFVALHHQSLLIAATWPAGKGNVAYGAMVGSNHTGRAPDQEIRVGEGVFFGLGCSVKFPTDLADAPYTVIAAGTSTLAQQVRFPFSLIATPVEPLDESASGIPRAFNEILPAWGLFANAYAIVRMELKFSQRDRARRTPLTYRVLSPPVMRLVRDACNRLAAVDGNGGRSATSHGTVLYTEAEVPGLGKNFLREDVRRQAIAAYTAALRRYALRVLLADAEGQTPPAEAMALARELADEHLPGLDREARLRLLVGIERENAAIVQASREADDRRGVRIIPDYAAAHAPATSDPVVRDAWARVQRTEERIRALLG